MPELAPEKRAPAGRTTRPDPRQGVFETMLVVDGRPLEFDAHLGRLSASLEELFPDRPPPAVADDVSRAQGVKLGSLRIAVAPGADRLAVEATVRNIDPEASFLAGDFSPHRGTKSPGPAIALSSFSLSGGLGAHKWADRSLLDEAQTGLPDDAIPLVVDCDGTVLEASRANLFAVRDGALVTPPTDGRILPGVTRMRVLQIAAAAGIDAEEAALDRADLLSADEVFLTGSVRGVEPVSGLDGTALVAKGEIAAEIGTELRRTWLSGRVG